MADFHPVVWMYDDDFKEVTYRYFNAQPIVEQNEGSYADTDAPISLPSIGWNHGMAEILSALMNNNVQIETFREYDYSPYPCFRHTEEFAPNKFRIKHFGDKIPMVYAIVGEKEG
ncbi:MAG: hypothetical protein H6607_03950 [Flavobacteriales bacterium]|nr:hypothetical protein [Flavobacteriales bacterium]